MLPSIGGLSVRDRALLSVLIRKRKQVIRVDDVIAQLPVTRANAQRILSRLQEKGWLRRAKRGLYLPVPLEATSREIAPEDPWALAMEIFNPCYISGWSAAEHWDLTEQIFNTTVVFTTKVLPNKRQQIAGLTYLTHRVNDQDIFGTKKIWRSGVPVIIADLHRTVIDILDLPQLGGGGRHALDVVRNYWRHEKTDPQKLLDYAQRLGRGTIFKRLGFTAELFGSVTDQWLESCRRRISTGISNLDSAGPSKGPIVSRWNLRINVPIEVRS